MALSFTSGQRGVTVNGTDRHESRRGGRDDHLYGGAQHEPSGTVTVTPSSGDTGAATLSPSSLTFTSGNWKTAQTVTVSGEEDNDVNNETVAISHSVSGYASVTTAANVSVTVTDNDTAGVSIANESERKREWDDHLYGGAQHGAERERYQHGDRDRDAVQWRHWRGNAESFQPHLHQRQLGYGTDRDGLRTRR